MVCIKAGIFRGVCNAASPDRAELGPSMKKTFQLSATMEEKIDAKLKQAVYCSAKH